ncbi:Golgi apyrase [Smittium culicis]|uniref:Golgi apyrase n=1 Tax=Smittium culicis TaxID=133412 RepID=A0A1R1Y8G2_9FUNG|nr:Golgi apyrase [Smittium culicis]OMJ23257.1 Golgi apyrase [Smittium culicis]
MIYSWTDLDVLINSAPNVAELNVFPEITFGRNDSDKNNSFKISPGISEYGVKIDKVGNEYIKPMIDFAIKSIPADKHNSTPVYLMATAGVRLLSKDIQKSLLSTACSYFKKHSNFLIKDCDHHFKTISGEEEGAYGWLSVNYLKSRFLPLLESSNNSNISEQSSKISEISNTFGFLDMGGASTQIAFQTNPNPSLPDTDQVKSISLRTLNGKDVSLNLFVTTFLGFGTNQARNRHEDQLSKNYAKNKEIFGIPVIEDPCLAPGQYYPTKNNSTILIGTGNFDLCVNKTRTLLNINDTPCPKAPCLINHNTLLDTNLSKMNFIGVSEYWFVSDDIFGLGGSWDMENFLEKTKEFCKTELDTSLKNYSHRPNTNSDRIKLQCFKAAWLFSILTDGFSLFPEHSSINQDDTKTISEPSSKISTKSSTFESIKEIDSKEASWTLGAMLLKLVETIPPADPKNSKKIGIAESPTSKANSQGPQDNISDENITKYINKTKILILTLAFISLFILALLMFSNKHLRTLIFYFKKIGSFIFKNKYVFFFNTSSKSGRSPNLVPLTSRPMSHPISIFPSSNISRSSSFPVSLSQEERYL